MGDLKNELQKMLEELELRKKKLSSLDFKQNQYVVLFKPVKGEGDLYGVTKKPLNKISSDIQDVLPVPGLEIIKVMGYSEALLQASKYSTIQVGDTRYVVCYGSVGIYSRACWETGSYHLSHQGTTETVIL